MYGHNLINGSFEWLGFPRFGCDDGPPWTDNILVIIPRWGVGGTVEILAGRSQPGGHYGSVDAPWCGAVPARPAYLPWSPENARATANARQSPSGAPSGVSKVSQIPDTSSVTSWSIGRIAPWMIFGISRLMNNFCRYFPLLV